MAQWMCATKDILISKRKEAYLALPAVIENAKKLMLVC